uniref:Putative kinesin motor domain-containing protein n=1 Tax=Linum usitatissimum TaxID=4006 RepID=A0A172MLK4_LINUS|nr:putative kinesin motor domain-containing protein [Linum usitatissimum]
MATSTPNHANQSTVPLSRKVRVVAKIRSLTNSEVFPGKPAPAASWISVSKPNGDDSNRVTVTLGEQSGSSKECFEIGYCYEEAEGNEVIFKRDVKTLLPGLFNGHNATIVACGARDSGKTHFVQVPVKSMMEFHKLYSGRNRTVRRLNQKNTTPLPSRSTKGLIVYILSHGEKLVRGSVGKINFVELAGYEDARRTSNAGNFSENAQINKSINALFKVFYSLHANETHVAYRESKLSRMLEDSLGGKSRILVVTCLNPFSCQDSINMLNLASRCCQSTDRVGLDPARKTNSTTRSKVFASHKSRLPGTGSVSSMRKQQTPSNLPVPGRKAGGNASALKARKLFDEKYHEKSEKKRNHPVIASVTELCSQEEVCSSSISLTTAASSVQEARLSYGTQEVSSTNFEDIPSVSFDVQESLSIEVSGPCTSTTSIDTVSVEQSVDNPVDITPATKTFIGGRSLDEKENDKSLVNEGESPPISARLQEISNTLKQLFKSTPSYEAIPFSNDPSLLQYQTSTPSKGPLTPELDRTANDIMDFETEIPSSDDPSVLQDQTSTPSIGPLTPKLNTTANDTLDFVKTIAHTTNDPSPPISTISIEPRTPECNIRRANNNTLDIASFCSPWEKLNRSNCGVKNSLVQEYLSFINTANKEDLKKLKGIGEKRAAYIMELREDSPFKDLDELKDVGMSAKQYIYPILREQSLDFWKRRSSIVYAISQTLPWPTPMPNFPSISISTIDCFQLSTQLLHPVTELGSPDISQPQGLLGRFLSSHGCSCNLFLQFKLAVRYPQRSPCLLQFTLQDRNLFR